MMTDLEVIRRGVSKPEMLTQLAEECCELAQAALKLRRAMVPGASPTPVSAELAEDDMWEEIADVALCLVAMDVGINVLLPAEACDIADQKRQRWARRLRLSEEA